jgi:hypothetical protein
VLAACGTQLVAIEVTEQRRQRQLCAIQQARDLDILAFRAWNADAEAAR